MFESRSCMFLRLFMLADIVMMGRLMVMMRSSVMVSGRRMVMLTRRMLQYLCHLPYGGSPAEGCGSAAFSSRRAPMKKPRRNAGLRDDPYAILWYGRGPDASSLNRAGDPPALPGRQQ